MTVAVQGFGNVGYHAAKFRSEDDSAKVVCIVERDGYLWKADNLDVEAVKRHQLATGSILGFEEAESYSDSNHGLEVECDILIPATMESAITLANVDRIHAKIDCGSRKRADCLCCRTGAARQGYYDPPRSIRECGRRNHQITHALETMTRKGFPTEMRDEFLEGDSEIDLMRSGLDDVMRSAYEQMIQTLRDYPEIRDFRTAAYRIALNRIAEAYKAIGI